MRQLFEQTANDLDTIEKASKSGQLTAVFGAFNAYIQRAAAANARVEM